MNEKELIGSWKLVEIGPPMYEIIDNASILILKKDNRYEYILFNGESSAGNWSLHSDNTLKFEDNEGSISSHFIETITNDTLILTFQPLIHKTYYFKYRKIK